MKNKKVLVMGLDCATPKIIFGDLLDRLPNIKRLIENGIAAKLHSSYPPITIPAWMVMATGKDPGQLGDYGFRYRKPEDYQTFHIANSHHIKEERVWETLEKYEKKSILVGIPPSYPPYKVNGHLVGCFITPDIKSDFTYPQSLKNEILAAVPEYQFDVSFRTEEREELLKNLYAVTESHFKAIEFLMREKEWDFFQFVEIGVDRIHHAFWKYFDREHHLYQPGNKFKDVIGNYYKFIDEKIGRLIDMAGIETTIFVVSDHGAKRMKGCFCINEWLIEKGYIVLKKYPEKVGSFEKLEVDWNKTSAWGWGGYYGRIYINKKGREKMGVIDGKDYEDFREKLKNEIENIRGPNNEKWKTIVHKPEHFYKEVKGYPPDLMVYFDDLSWRSAGTVGRKKLYLEENDTGPDDAVHDWNGIFIKYDKSNHIKNPARKIGQYNILDVRAMILREFGIQIS
ncbi:MAG: alkaline phosphatase family protein [Candidatus Ratteibacteria bacterium]|nr:alkaline phosphatase family protein [Candidatus Ratteibacteria bacterium]